MRSILITGCSGCVGRALLKRIDPGQFETIYGLDQFPPQLASSSPKFKFLQGDLSDVNRWEDELTGVDTVIHLAAITGKAAPEMYFRVNLEGTKRLINLAQKIGARHFVFVSSIAARFRDQTRYYYAQSKRAAEDAVRASGLGYVIVRPTIVIGPGGGAYEGLARMARGSVIPVVGSGKTLVQPIHVDDLAFFLLACATDPDADGQTYELGGPDPIPIEALLQKIHLRLRGSPGRCLHIPARPLFGLLGLLERLVYGLLPVTAAQLSSFTERGDIQSNPLFERYRPQLQNVDAMLDSAARAARIAQLRRECDRFTRYLTGKAATPYVREKYCDAHQKLALEPTTRLDRSLVQLAKVPLAIKSVDLYARLLARKSALRKKLVLLLAILESTPAAEQFLDPVDAESKLGLLLKLLQYAVTFGIAGLGALLVAPVHVVLKLLPEKALRQQPTGSTVAQPVALSRRAGLRERRG